MKKDLASSSVESLNDAIKTIGMDHYLFMLTATPYTRANLINGAWFANNLEIYEAYKTLFNEGF